jgi:hypothetical protein
MANNHSDTEKRLWEAADEFRANPVLNSSEYAVPVLGLIFLRYADHRFTIAEKELEGKGSGRRKIGKEDYQAKGVMYVPPEAVNRRLAIASPRQSENYATGELIQLIGYAFAPQSAAHAQQTRCVGMRSGAAGCAAVHLEGRLPAARSGSGIRRARHKSARVGRLCGLVHRNAAGCVF